MKRIQYHSYGGPEVMRLEAFELERPADDEVAVAVRFAALNPIDWKVRNGAMKIVTGKSFPRGMGLDLSGTVTAVGSKVVRFRVGQKVFGMARFKQAGALGEAVIVKDEAIAVIPENVTFEQAACLGTAGVTAWNALIDKASMKSGQRVFINGCGGVVGEAAVQIARMYGARVSGTCSLDAMERARSFGMHEVYDYKTIDLTRFSERFDVVFDAAGTMTTAAGIGLLRQDGAFATVEPTPLRFIRAVFDRRLKPIVGTPRAELLDKLANAARSGALVLPISETVPLSQAISLITSVEKGRRLRGKALVAMS